MEQKFINFAFALIHQETILLWN